VLEIFRKQTPFIEYLFRFKRGEKVFEEH